MRIFTTPKSFNDYANKLEAKGTIFLMSVHRTPKGKDFWTIRVNYIREV